MPFCPGQVPTERVDETLSDGERHRTNEVSHGRDTVWNVCEAGGANRLRQRPGNACLSMEREDT